MSLCDPIRDIEAATLQPQPYFMLPCNGWDREVQRKAGDLLAGAGRCADKVHHLALLLLLWSRICCLLNFISLGRLLRSFVQFWHCGDTSFDGPRAQRCLKTPQWHIGGLHSNFDSWGPRVAKALALFFQGQNLEYCYSIAHESRATGGRRALRSHELRARCG